jgi:hypothetical protein
MNECRKPMDSSDYDTYNQRLREIEHFALLAAPKVCDKTDLVPAKKIERLCNPKMYKYFNQFYVDALHGYLGHKMFNPKYEFYVTKSVSPQHRHYPRDRKFPSSKNSLIQHFMAAAVEKEIVACGRSIFIAKWKELQVEIRYLQQNYPQTTFYVGDGNIEQGRMQKLVWQYKEGNPILAQFLIQILQSGLMAHISNIQNHNRYLERRLGTKIIKEKPTAGGIQFNSIY